MFKTIEYVQGKSIYSIHSSENKITIRIFDSKNNRVSETVIDNEVLRERMMTIVDLAAEIYKQSVH